MTKLELFKIRLEDLLANYDKGLDKFLILDDIAIFRLNTPLYNIKDDDEENTDEFIKTILSKVNLSGFQLYIDQNQVTLIVCDGGYSNSFHCALSFDHFDRLDEDCPDYLTRYKPGSFKKRNQSDGFESALTCDYNNYPNLKSTDDIQYQAWIEEDGKIIHQGKVIKEIYPLYDNKSQNDGHEHYITLTSDDDLGLNKSEDHRYRLKIFKYIVKERNSEGAIIKGDQDVIFEKDELALDKLTKENVYKFIY